MKKPYVSPQSELQQLGHWLADLTDGGTASQSGLAGKGITFFEDETSEEDPWPVSATLWDDVE